MQSILPIYTSLFEGRQLQVYGTHEEPLFNCVEIAEALGYQDTNQQNIVADYLTERGIYEYLFESDKQITKRLGIEIVTLIKKLRLDKIELLLKEKQELQEILSKTKKTIQLYELKTEDNKVYRGYTTDFNRRIKQHRRNSCSPGVREAYARGGSVQERIVHTLDVYTNDDIKLRESEFILQVPQEQRLNKVIPKPDMNKVVLEHITEEQQPRATDNYYKNPSLQKEIAKQQWMEKYRQLVSYLEKHTEYPSKHSDDEVSRKLGYWVSDMKKQQASGRYNTLDSERALLLEQLRNWKWSKSVEIPEFQSFNDMYILLKQYIEKTGQIPTNTQSINVNVRYLTLWIIHIRAEYVLKRLNENQIEVMQQLQNWNWHTIDSFHQKYTEIRDYAIQCKQLPKQDSIAKWIGQVRIKYLRKQLNEERIALLESIPDWKWECSTDKQIVWDTFYNQVKQFIHENKRVPTAGKLGKWCCHQREFYVNQQLATDRADKLNALGNVWYWTAQQKQELKQKKQ